MCIRLSVLVDVFYYFKVWFHSKSPDDLFSF